MAVLVVGTMTAALAHVGIETDADPDPGRIVPVSFVFDHGCNGEPTTEFRVLLPDGITDVDVDPVAEGGWEARVADGVLTWSGGEPVPDHQLHAFSAEIALPNQPGETLYFPTIQRCGDAESAWIQVPGEGEEPGDLDAPAPSLTLTDRPAPEEPATHDLEDETPPPPADEDEEPTMEPVATPVADAEETRGWLPVVFGLALAAAVIALVAAAIKRSRVP
jgi:periplasmic copper chaperone A